MVLQGTTVLPQPASKDAMDSLNNWMHGEVAPEDLPQIDEEAAKVRHAQLLHMWKNVCS
mgnify:CR=1 FL=1